MVNSIPNYIYSGSLGVGRPTANDANTYLQIGPNGAGTKGIILPWVADTSAITGTKRNFLLIRSSQLGNFAYWDSVGGKWISLGAAAIDTTVLSSKNNVLKVVNDSSKVLRGLATSLSDTSIISTKANVQDVIDDTASVLRSYVTTASSSSPLNTITAAAAANTINNANYAQEWQWNSLTNVTALKLSSTSTSATGAGQHQLLDVSTSGDNATSGVQTRAASFSNNRTGSFSVNTAVQNSASSGYQNIGIWNVGGFGTYNTGANNQAVGYTTGTYNIGAQNSVSGGASGAINYGSYNVASGSAAATSYGAYGYSDATSGNAYGIFGNASGAATTNYGGYFTASGATNNYALVTTGGRVGFGTSTPSDKAIVEMSSTTQGFLPPRMTNTQRDAISSPPAGLMVYDTTVNKVSVYNGSEWKYLAYE